MQARRVEIGLGHSEQEAGVDRGFLGSLGALPRADTELGHEEWATESPIPAPPAGSPLASPPQVSSRLILGQMAALATRKGPSLDQAGGAGQPFCPPSSEPHPRAHRAQPGMATQTEILG